MQHDDSFWKDLARTEWRRKKWRRPEGVTGLEQCRACRLPLFRKGTYYVRPAYTAGDKWLCQKCYAKMMRVAGQEFTERYGRSSPDRPNEDR